MWSIDSVLGSNSGSFGTKTLSRTDPHNIQTYIASSELATRILAPQFFPQDFLNFLTMIAVGMGKFLDMFYLPPSRWVAQRPGPQLSS
jgi:hypothetical protein